MTVSTNPNGTPHYEFKGPLAIEAWVYSPANSDWISMVLEWKPESYNWEDGPPEWGIQIQLRYFELRDRHLFNPVLDAIVSLEEESLETPAPEDVVRILNDAGWRAGP